MLKLVPKICGTILVVLSLAEIGEAMSKAQALNSAKLMRNVCQPKLKIADEKVQNIRNGDFQEDHDVMCYIKCVLEMGQIMKAGKLNYDAAIKQIDMMLPEPMKSSMKKSLDVCRPLVEKYKDPCEASYYGALCIYKEDPENFFFP